MAIWDGIKKAVNNFWDKQYNKWAEQAKTLAESREQNKSALIDTGKKIAKPFQDFYDVGYRAGAEEKREEIKEPWNTEKRMFQEWMREITKPFEDLGEAIKPAVDTFVETVKKDPVEYLPGLPGVEKVSDQPDTILGRTSLWLKKISREHLKPGAQAYFWGITKDLDTIEQQEPGTHKPLDVALKTVWELGWYMATEMASAVLEMPDFARQLLENSSEYMKDKSDWHELVAYKKEQEGKPTFVAWTEAVNELTDEDNLYAQTWFQIINNPLVAKWVGEWAKKIGDFWVQYAAKASTMNTFKRAHDLISKWDARLGKKMLETIDESALVLRKGTNWFDNALIKMQNGDTMFHRIISGSHLKTKSAEKAAMSALGDIPASRLMKLKNWGRMFDSDWAKSANTIMGRDWRKTVVKYNPTLPTYQWGSSLSRFVFGPIHSVSSAIKPLAKLDVLTAAGKVVDAAGKITAGIFSERIPLLFYYQIASQLTGWSLAHLEMWIKSQGFTSKYGYSIQNAFDTMVDWVSDTLDQKALNKFYNDLNIAEDKRLTAEEVIEEYNRQTTSGIHNFFETAYDISAFINPFNYAGVVLEGREKPVIPRLEGKEDFNSQLHPDGPSAYLNEVLTWSTDIKLTKESEKLISDIVDTIETGRLPEALVQKIGKGEQTQHYQNAISKTLYLNKRAYLANVVALYGEKNIANDVVIQRDITEYLGAADRWFDQVVNIINESDDPKIKKVLFWDLMTQAEERLSDKDKFILSNDLRQRAVDYNFNKKIENAGGADEVILKMGRAYKIGTELVMDNTLGKLLMNADRRAYMREGRGNLASSNIEGSWKANMTKMTQNITEVAPVVAGVIAINSINERVIKPLVWRTDKAFLRMNPKLNDNKRFKMWMAGLRESSEEWLEMLIDAGAEYGNPGENPRMLWDMGIALLQSFLAGAGAGYGQENYRSIEDYYSDSRNLDRTFDEMNAQLGNIDDPVVEKHLRRALGQSAEFIVDWLKLIWKTNHGVETAKTIIGVGQMRHVVMDVGSRVRDMILQDLANMSTITKDGTPLTDEAKVLEIFKDMNEYTKYLKGENMYEFNPDYAASIQARNQDVISQADAVINEIKSAIESESTLEEFVNRLLPRKTAKWEDVPMSIERDHDFDVPTGNTLYDFSFLTSWRSVSRRETIAEALGLTKDPEIFDSKKGLFKKGIQQKVLEKIQESNFPDRKKASLIQILTNGETGGIGSVFNWKGDLTSIGVEILSLMNFQTVNVFKQAKYNDVIRFHGLRAKAGIIQKAIQETRGSKAKEQKVFIMTTDGKRISNGMTLSGIEPGTIFKDGKKLVKFKDIEADLKAGKKVIFEWDRGLPDVELFVRGDQVFVRELEAQIEARAAAEDVAREIEEIIEQREQASELSKEVDDAIAEAEQAEDLPGDNDAMTTRNDQGELIVESVEFSKDDNIFESDRYKKTIAKLNPFPRKLSSVPVLTNRTNIEPFNIHWKKVIVDWVEYTAEKLYDTGNITQNGYKFTAMVLVKAGEETYTPKQVGLFNYSRRQGVLEWSNTKWVRDIETKKEVKEDRKIFFVQYANGDVKLNTTWRYMFGTKAERLRAFKKGNLYEYNNDIISQNELIANATSIDIEWVAVLDLSTKGEVEHEAIDRNIYSTIEDIIEAVNKNGEAALEMRESREQSPFTEEAEVKAPVERKTEKLSKLDKKTEQEIKEAEKMALEEIETTDVSEHVNNPVTNGQDEANHIYENGTPEQKKELAAMLDSYQITFSALSPDHAAIFLANIFDGKLDFQEAIATIVASEGNDAFDIAFLNAIGFDNFDGSTLESVMMHQGMKDLVASLRLKSRDTLNPGDTTVENVLHHMTVEVGKKIYPQFDESVGSRYRYDYMPGFYNTVWNKVIDSLIDRGILLHNYRIDDWTVALKWPVDKTISDKYLSDADYKEMMSNDGINNHTKYMVSIEMLKDGLISKSQFDYFVAKLGGYGSNWTWIENLNDLSKKLWAAGSIISNSIETNFPHIKDRNVQIALFGSLISFWNSDIVSDKKIFFWDDRTATPWAAGDRNSYEYLPKYLEGTLLNLKGQDGKLYFNNRSRSMIKKAIKMIEADINNAPNKIHWYDVFNVLADSFANDTIREEAAAAMGDDLKYMNLTEEQKADIRKKAKDQVGKPKLTKAKKEAFNAFYKMYINDRAQFMKTAWTLPADIRAALTEQFRKENKESTGIKGLGIAPVLNFLNNWGRHVGLKSLNDFIIARSNEAALERLWVSEEEYMKLANYDGINYYVPSILSRTMVTEMLADIMWIHWLNREISTYVLTDDWISMIPDTATINETDSMLVNTIDSVKHIISQENILQMREKEERRKNPSALPKERVPFNLIVPYGMRKPKNLPKHVNVVMAQNYGYKNGKLYLLDSIEQRKPSLETFKYQIINRENIEVNDFMYKDDDGNYQGVDVPLFRETAMLDPAFYQSILFPFIESNIPGVSLTTVGLEGVSELLSNQDTIDRLKETDLSMWSELVTTESIDISIDNAIKITQALLGDGVQIETSHVQSDVYLNESINNMYNKIIESMLRHNEDMTEDEAHDMLQKHQTLFGLFLTKQKAIDIRWDHIWHNEGLEARNKLFDTKSNKLDEITNIVFKYLKEQWRTIDYDDIIDFVQEESFSEAYPKTSILETYTERTWEAVEELRNVFDENNIPLSSYHAIVGSKDIDATYRSEFRDIIRKETGESVDKLKEDVAKVLGISAESIVDWVGKDTQISDMDIDKTLETYTDLFYDFLAEYTDIDIQSYMGLKDTELTTLGDINYMGVELWEGRKYGAVQWWMSENVVHKPAEKIASAWPRNYLNRAVYNYAAGRNIFNFEATSLKSEVLSRKQADARDNKLDRGAIRVFSQSLKNLPIKARADIIAEIIKFPPNLLWTDVLTEYQKDIDAMAMNPNTIPSKIEKYRKLISNWFRDFGTEFKNQGTFFATFNSVSYTETRTPRLDNSKFFANNVVKWVAESMRRTGVSDEGIDKSLSKYFLDKQGNPIAPSTEQLKALDLAIKAIEEGKGRLFIAGLAGAGKTTTIAAVIKYLETNNSIDKLDIRVKKHAAAVTIREALAPYNFDIWKDQINTADTLVVQKKWDTTLDWFALEYSPSGDAILRPDAPRGKVIIIDEWHAINDVLLKPILDVLAETNVVIVAGDPRQIGNGEIFEDKVYTNPVEWESVVLRSTNRASEWHEDINYANLINAYAQDVLRKSGVAGIVVNDWQSFEAYDPDKWVDRSKLKWRTVSLTFTNEARNNINTSILGNKAVSESTPIYSLWSNVSDEFNVNSITMAGKWNWKLGRRSISAYQGDSVSRFSYRDNWDGTMDIVVHRTSETRRIDNLFHVYKQLGLSKDDTKLNVYTLWYAITSAKGAGMDFDNVIIDPTVSDFFEYKSQKNFYDALTRAKKKIFYPEGSPFIAEISLADAERLVRWDTDWIVIQKKVNETKKSRVVTMQTPVLTYKTYQTVAEEIIKYLSDDKNFHDKMKTNSLLFSAGRRGVSVTDRGVLDRVRAMDWRYISDATALEAIVDTFNHLDARWYIKHEWSYDYMNWMINGYSFTVENAPTVSDEYIQDYDTMREIVNQGFEVDDSSSLSDMLARDQKMIDEIGEKEIFVKGLKNVLSQRKRDRADLLAIDEISTNDSVIDYINKTLTQWPVADQIRGLLVTNIENSLSDLNIDTDAQFEAIQWKIVSGNTDFIDIYDSLSILGINPDNALQRVYDALESHFEETGDTRIENIDDVMRGRLSDQDEIVRNLIQTELNNFVESEILYGVGKKRYVDMTQRQSDELILRDAMENNFLPGYSNEIINSIEAEVSRYLSDNNIDMDANRILLDKKSSREKSPKLEWHVDNIVEIIQNAAHEWVVDTINEIKSNEDVVNPITLKERMTDLLDKDC